MKKIVLLALAVSLSQAGLSQEVKWGVKAGYNLSTFDGDYDGIDYVPGFHAGALSEIKLSPKFALQAELLYSQEGGKYDFEMELPTMSIEASEKVKLGYLNMPIMAKYYVIDGFSLEAGPQIGLLLSGKSEYDASVTIDGETFEESGSMDIKDHMKAISYGFNFGCGYEFKNNLFFQARYHLGLSNNSKGNDNGEDEDEFSGANPDKLKNQGFQLSVGYKF